jgi:hypothetical protein
MKRVFIGDQAVMKSPGRATRIGAWLPTSAVYLAGDLEELRTSVLRHLDSLEVLALHGRSAPAEEAHCIEQALKRQIEELEQERRNLLARVEQDTSGSHELVKQLESDRQLLAAAWERLERERLEGGGGRPAGGTAPHPRPGEAGPAADRPILKAHSPGPAANPVADTILRQFQTLCSDVRRTTDARSSPR